MTQSIDREEYNSIEIVIYASDGVQTTEWKKRIQVRILLILKAIYIFFMIRK